LSEPTRYLSVEGNFEGEGKKEVILLLVRSDGSAFAPFIATENERGIIKLSQVEAASPREYLGKEGVKSARPGRYLTACDKGYDCYPADKKTITLSFEGVEFFENEGPSRVIYFDPTRRAFTESWLSD
jgi:hypothetical protein